MRTKEKLIDLYLLHKGNKNFIRAGQMKGELIRSHGMTGEDFNRLDIVGKSSRDNGVFDMFNDIVGGRK